MTQLDPIILQSGSPFFGICGLTPQNAGNTMLTIHSGQAQDFNNVITMVLNNNTVLNTSVNGVNGLDTGTLAASSMYYIYLIGDSSNKNPVATLASLNLFIGGVSSYAVYTTPPVLPFGYDSIRLIGCWGTDSSTHFYLGNYIGNNGGSGNIKKFYYYNPQSVLSGGNATTATSVSLTGLVPALTATYTECLLSLSFTPATAGNILQIGIVTGSYITRLTGQVANVATTANASVMNGGTTGVFYLVGNSSDSASISVQGFTMYL